MKRKRAIVLATVMLVAPIGLLWLAGQVFGLGIGFDKPGVPQGAKFEGPAAKGAITYVVDTNTGSATIEFHGLCSNKAVNTDKLNVTSITNSTSFAAATAQAIADSVENFFSDNSIVVTPLQTCWNKPVFGVYVTAVNGAGSKVAVSPTIYVWTGDATIKGVR